MKSVDTYFAETHARSEQACSGIGPALMGGLVGGTVLGALTLSLGFGWLTALAVYSLGGSAVVVLLAVLREPEYRPNVPIVLPLPVPVPVRVLP
jgi:predicted lipid-binding transport protein (Tim44 family)